MQEENGVAMEVERLELHRSLSVEMPLVVGISRLLELRRCYGIGVDTLEMEIRWNRVG